MDNTGTTNKRMLTYDDLVFDGTNLPTKITATTITSDRSKTIKNLNGKYIKLLLSRLESRFEISKEMRKVILDTMNDYGREICEELAL